MVNAMSVDVEDYFQVSAFDSIVPRDSWASRESRVERNTERLLDLFHSRGVRATFFILGWVAERYPRLVTQIASHGHELASHGFHHQLVYTLTPGQFREDVRRAKATIEDAGGSAVRGYRAPSFSIVRTNLWALDVLIEEGHAYDASVFPIHHDRYGIPDAPRRPHRLDRAAGSIVEVPASTVRLGGINVPIAGGGYFRQLPYAWTRWGISRVNRVDGDPVIFYIHPWEVDPDQPQLPVSPLTRMRHYRNIDDTMRRLGQLLDDFAFDTIAAALQARQYAATTAMSRCEYAK
jgi:polysaccharide deacetylase family protein (PEP-CTERM system associated)